MKKLMFTLLIVLSTTFVYGETTHTYHFYLEDDYVGQGELYHTLFTEVGNTDQLFLWCCDCIMFYARAFKTSYNTMNLILFVFLQPFIIFMFFLLIVK